MKTTNYVLLLFLSSFLFNANAQLNKLSTFEEMWIVSTAFDGVDGEAFDGIDGESITPDAGFGRVNNFNKFSTKGKHQASDLAKIIADTPFLSLEITDISTINNENQKGDARISLEPHPWDSLDKLGKGSFSILLKSGKSYFLFIPTGAPELLEKKLRTNGGFLKSGISGLNQINIEAIRIENGTYIKKH